MRRSDGSQCSTTSSSPSWAVLKRTATRLGRAQDGPRTKPGMPLPTTSSLRRAATRSPGTRPPVHGVRWISAGTTFKLLHLPSSRRAKAMVTRPLGSVALWPITVPTTPCFTTTMPFTLRSFAAVTLSPRRKPPAITNATSSARQAHSTASVPPPCDTMSKRTSRRSSGSSGAGPTTSPHVPTATGARPSTEIVRVAWTRAPTSRPPGTKRRISLTTQFKRFRLPSSRWLKDTVTRC
mmetsp:Transcript_137023/g.251953  ORF Transcript_137023/g.251953 Transcript_137023/m.251953 type:complete len:237 (-) Transcript_137023:51-761(-)